MRTRFWLVSCGLLLSILDPQNDKDMEESYYFNETHLNASVSLNLIYDLWISGLCGPGGEAPI
jgi:hypothetical protein